MHTGCPRAAGVNSLSVHGSSHAAVGMADAPDGDGVGLDILWQGNAAVTGVTQVMNVGSGHLGHQSDLADGGGVRPLLGSTNGGDGQAA